jgi:eukaryotic-like serine/threonine-protein kinase
MDVSAVAPFTNVECPKCGKHTRVKREFGPYTLTRRHAVGGMSMVFVAHDPTLDREVALKILSEDYSADERRIAAFEEEARITASFSHPNVVRVLRTGHAFGRYYIAMEFVPGGHFEHHIRERGVIPEVEMLPLAIEVAQGLKAAHAAGLIHRDVKPGNILLDAEGHAKLVDFGLALVTHGGTATATEMWATPYYVPPETVEGHAEDFRSDIYAFGATLYHALAGKPPCNEESMATDILREAKKKVIPLQTANPAVSAETCRVVARAMAYDPGARFSSYDELISALGSALNQLKSGNPTGPGTAARRRLDKKRRETGQLIAAVVAVTAACLFALGWSKRGKPKPPPPPAPPPPAVNPAVSPAPAPEPDKSAGIARTFRDAQAALEAGDYERATDNFIPLFRDAAVQEPTRSWAGIQAVLAKLLGGHLSAARELAPEVVDHLRSLTDQEIIAPGPLKMLEQLPRLEPLNLGSAADSTPAGVSGMMAGMIAGLKNWEQGMLDQAAACFTAAAAVKLPANDAWAAIYQKLAADYLSDYQVLSGPLFSRFPDDKNGCDQAVNQLEGLIGGLKTQGRARFNVRAWQTDLKRAGKLLEAAKSADRTRREQAVPAAPPLAEVEGRLAGFSKDCRFADAAAYLKSLPADPPGASRASLLTLAESAAVFIADLEQDLRRAPVAASFRLRSGEAVAAISIDSRGGLSVTPPNGSPRPCQWADFPPESLIELHRIFVKNPQGEPERARRNECAISYGWLTGNRELALTAASNLSQTSPDFKNRWETILKGLPK